MTAAVPHPIQAWSLDARRLRDGDIGLEIGLSGDGQDTALVLHVPRSRVRQYAQHLLALAGGGPEEPGPALTSPSPTPDAPAPAAAEMERADG